MAKNKIILYNVLGLGSYNPSKLKNFICSYYCPIIIFYLFWFFYFKFKFKYKVYKYGKKRNSKGRFIQKNNGELNIRIPGFLKILETLAISSIILFIIFLGYLFIKIDNLKEIILNILSLINK